MKNFLKNIGFSMIEMIVVTGILALMSVVGIMMYNSFFKGFDLEISEEFVLSIVDEKKLNVLTGRANCAQLMFFAGESYFLTIEHTQDSCKDTITQKNNIPLVSRFGLNKKNELQVIFKNVDHPKTIEKFESGGNVERIDVPEGTDKTYVSLSDSHFYRFVIYEDENREKTESVWGLYYYSEKNVDVNNTDLVIAKETRSVDLNHQSQNGKILMIEFEYPEGKGKSYLDETGMKYGSILLEKENTALDPMEISFENY